MRLSALSGGVLTVTTAVLCLGLATAPAAQAQSAAQPKVSIVIDDLGYSKRYARAFLNMPVPITMAVLPHTPHAKWIARATQEAGRELMLHLPMQSKIQPKQEAPGLLKVGMRRQQFLRTLESNLNDFSGYTGINNHMGSRMMSDSDSLEWVMESLAGQDVFFLDSKTVGNSPASQIALRYGVETESRDVFLDSKRDRAFISGQFDVMMKQALATGRSIAIGHPYQETVDVLNERLPELRRAGIQVVPVQAFLQKSTKPYQAERLLTASVKPARVKPTSEQPVQGVKRVKPAPEAVPALALKAEASSPSVQAATAPARGATKAPTQVLSSSRPVSADRLDDYSPRLPELSVTVSVQ